MVKNKETNGDAQSNAWLSKQLSSAIFLLVINDTALAIRKLRSVSKPLSNQRE